MQAFVDILVIGAAYLLGSIPFGLLLTKWKGKGDIRQIGSGNIGATNVLRTGDKSLALWTLFLDGFKGFLAVVIAQELMSPEIAPLTGLTVVLGHIYPVWLHFKGGKGVATTLAVLLATSFSMVFWTCAVWGLAFYVTRISSLSAIMAMIFAPVYAIFFLQDSAVSWVIFLLAALVIYKHQSNIIRLLRGQEHSFK
jgi:glycerol-3-phosphate acyltransferase PlsY